MGCVCVCVSVGQESPSSSSIQENQNSEKESELTKVTQLMNGCKVQESHGPFCSPDGLFRGLWVWGPDHSLGFLSTEHMTGVGLGAGARVPRLSHWLADPLGLPFPFIICLHSSMMSHRHHPIFKERTDSEKKSDVPKITQPGSGRAQTHTQIVSHCGEQPSVLPSPPPPHQGLSALPDTRGRGPSLQVSAKCHFLRAF